MKQSETKHLHLEIVNNATLEHNEYTRLKSNLLDGIVPGTRAFERTGDKIYLKGISLKMYFENQQYRPLVRYKIVIFRNKKDSGGAGILPTGSSTLWEGTSTSKNLDWFNTNVIDFKTVKDIVVRAPNSGSSLALNAYGGTSPDGVANVEHLGESYEVITNPSRQVNIWIPFNKNIQFDDNTNQAPNNIWQIGVITYGTHGQTTSGSVYPCGHVTAVAKLYWKDM